MERSYIAAVVLCSSLLMPFPARAQHYYENFALRGEIASSSVDLSSLIGLPDEAFLQEVRRLQNLQPEAAYTLAEEATRQRPHLAHAFSYQNPVQSYQPSIEPEGSDGGGGLIMTGGALAVLGGVAAFVATGSGEAGGGSGGGGGITFRTTTLPAVPIGWEEDAPDWEDGEYGIDHSKGMINASSAYARAGTGAGINVGLIDGGIDPLHDEFAGRIGGCFDMQTGASGSTPADCVDPDDHGTHVAGSIAAARDGDTMFGVAFEADLFSLRGFSSGASGTWIGTAPNFEDAISWAASNDVAVINNSYGHPPHNYFPPGTIDAVTSTLFGNGFDLARSNGIIMVWSTGNEAESQPSLQAAMPLYDPSLRNLWVAVTSVDGNGDLSYYANACGAAAEWCIAAPGGSGMIGDGIVSAVVGGGYSEEAGTSMAAPQVTGALAIMLQLFGPGTPSNLAPRDIVQILFQTADKSFAGFVPNADGVSPIYGQGVLDLDAATTPSTYQLRFSTPGGSSLSVMNSGIVSGAAFGRGVRAALSGKTLAVFDDFNRAVVIDLEKFASQAGETVDLERALANFGQGNGFQDVVTEGGFKLALRGSFSEDEGGISLGGNGQARLTVELTESTVLESGYNVDASHMLGMYGRGTAAPELLIDPAALSSSFLALAESAVTTGIRRSGSDGDLTLMAFGGTDYRPEETELDARLSGEDERNWTYGVAAEWTTTPADAFSLALRSGAMIEADELLGAEMEGGFGVSQTETAFVGATVTYNLASSLTLVGAYDIGLSVVAAEDSLFSDFGTVVSDSFSIGLLGKDGLQERDRYGLIISQPLRVSSSEAQMLLSQGRNADGSLNYSTEDVDLAPQDRELRVQAFYAAEMGDGKLGFGGLMRLNPGHDANAATEWAAVASYQGGF